MFQNLCVRAKNGNSSCHQKTLENAEAPQLAECPSMCLQAIILSVEQKQLQETELIFHCATGFSSKTISRILIRV